MGADELDQHSLVGIGNVDDYAVFVAGNVEDQAIIRNEIDGSAKFSLHIRRAGPNGPADRGMPGAKRCLRLRMALPEQLQGPLGDDLHGRTYTRFPNMEQGLSRHKAGLVSLLAGICVVVALKT
jgi:hypothetical protein